jgi:uncharacterized protein with PIN domain
MCVIIDTSALVAIAYREVDFDVRRRAICENRSRIPSPVIVEIHPRAGAELHPASRVS